MSGTSHSGAICVRNNWPCNQWVVFWRCGQETKSTHPFPKIHWTGWRHHCWPGGSYAASHDVCKCHMVQYIHFPLDKPSHNSDCISSPASLQLFYSQVFCTSWKPYTWRNTTHWLHHFRWGPVAAEPFPYRRAVMKTAHLRYCELNDVVESLFEQHDHSHLDKEVCQTAAGMTLEHTTVMSVSTKTYIWMFDYLHTSSSRYPARRT